MMINLVLDTTAQAAPLAIRTAWSNAANQLDALITESITVNLNVHYSGSGGGGSAGPAAGFFESYSSVYSQLTGTASPGDASFSGVPSTNPFAGSPQIVVWSAQAKAMGLIPGNGTAIDGFANFSTDIAASLMTGVALHEFAQALGRVPASGTNPDIFDLFRFTGVGIRLVTDAIPAPAAYFSLNNGVNKWADWGETSDPSAFLNTNLTPNDPFDEFYNSNTHQFLTPADLEELDTLGYHLNRLAPAVEGHDINGDNNGDVLLQNGSGNIVYANMVGGAFSGFTSLGNTPGYNVVGSGKIFGDVDANPVLQSAGGQIIYERVVNGLAVAFLSVANTPGYSVVGIGDINRDDHEDIVLENSSGQTIYANMPFGFFSSFVNVANAPGYAVDGVGDVNGDGFADVVFENAGGNIVYENMANGVANGFVAVTNTPGYAVKGVADINRDGNADIVLENAGGTIVYYSTRNNAFVNVATVPGYNVDALEDVNGDGYKDIVLENGSGQLVYANMAGGTFQGFVNIANAPGYSGHNEPAAGSTVGPVSISGRLGNSGGPGAVTMSAPGPGSGVTGMRMVDPGPAASGSAPWGPWGGLMADWLAGSSSGGTPSNLGLGGNTQNTSLADQMFGQLLHPGSST